jgi:two-component system chemotaxis response regulator CheY
MFTDYINILGECSKDILKDMANIDVANIKINKDEQLKTSYSFAHFIQYNDFENKVKGQFILGFVDENAAISIASKIAENMGLEPVKQLDETASDIINEFLNTVVGHTISEWDKNGLNVQFSSPDSMKDKNIDIAEMPNTEAYLINLKMSDALDLSLMVTFSKLINKRILVVDDSKVIRSILTKALKKYGYIVEEAKDGKEATVQYRNFKPDLTIMDLVMPQMGGLDAIIKIKESDPNANFVVLTSSSKKDEVVTAKTLNVLDYIIKPLKMEEFLEKISKLFERIDGVED